MPRGITRSPSPVRPQRARPAAAWWCGRRRRLFLAALSHAILRIEQFVTAITAKARHSVQSVPGGAARCSRRENVQAWGEIRVWRVVGQSCPAWNVLQLETCPDRSPVMNQRVRCSDEPWVKASGTTYLDSAAAAYRRRWRMPSAWQLRHRQAR